MTQKKKERIKDEYGLGLVLKLFGGMILLIAALALSSLMTNSGSPIPGQ